MTHKTEDLADKSMIELIQKLRDKVKKLARRGLLSPEIEAHLVCCEYVTGSASHMDKRLSEMLKFKHALSTQKTNRKGRNGKE